VLKSVEKRCIVILHVKKFGCLISDTSFFVVLLAEYLLKRGICLWELKMLQYLYVTGTIS